MKTLRQLLLVIALATITSAVDIPCGPDSVPCGAPDPCPWFIPSIFCRA